jgi:hypothetical protein
MRDRNALNGTGDAMRKIFVVYALVFALVTAATATVMATTLPSQALLSDTTR